MKRLLCFVLATLLLLFLAACDKSGSGSAPEEPPEKITPDFVVAENGASSFVIVRGENASKDEINVAVALREMLREQLGVTVELKEDFIREGTKFVAQDNEIVVGLTNRAESADASEGLKMGEYRILQKGTRLAIAFGSAEAGMEALDWFAEHCIFPEQKLAGVPNGFDYAVRREFTYDTITIAGHDISEYTVIGDDSFTSRVREKIGELTGIPLKTSATRPKKGLMIRLERMPDLAYDELALRVVDGHLTAGTSGIIFPPSEAADMLLDLFASSGGAIADKTEIKEKITMTAEEQAARDAAKAKSPYNDGKIMVACWGDSLTEGMGHHDKCYPVRLQAMLGNGYRVLNGGDGGETTVSIGARQGGLKTYLQKEVRFPTGVATVDVGTQDELLLAIENGRKVSLSGQLGNGMSINKITIDGKEYTFKYKDFKWTPSTTYTLQFTRTDTSKELVLPVGTEIRFNHSEVSLLGGIDIYFIGGNGGFDNDMDVYLEQLRAMIRYHGTDKYLVIVPFWDDKKYSRLPEEFGDHAIDFKAAVLEDGLAYEKLTPTPEDKAALSAGNVPPALRYNNEPTNVHLNEYGYDFLAHLIYERGKQLGFWK